MFPSYRNQSIDLPFKCSVLFSLGEDWLLMGEIVFSVQKQFSEDVCSVKKVFIKMLQNAQENTCTRVFFECCRLRSAILLKKRPWHRCFPVNFAKFSRTSFFVEHLRWLLLSVNKRVEMVMISVFIVKNTVSLIRYHL